MTSPNGFVSKPTVHSVDEVVVKLLQLLRAGGVTLFALIDHSGEAEKVGLKIRPTKLLIFGSPKGGTPLMQAVPTIAIDLPLKYLSGKMPPRKFGFPTTLPNILRNGIICRPS